MSPLTDTHQFLFVSQQCIGWDHLFYRNFSWEWTKATTPISCVHGNSTQQTSSFPHLSKLWSMVNSFWLQSNEHLHDTPTLQLHYVYLWDLHLTWHWYDTIHVLASDSAIFYYPLAEHQKHLTTSLCNFLLFTSPIVNCTVSKTLMRLDPNPNPLMPILALAFQFLLAELSCYIIHPIVDHNFDLELDWAGINAHRLHSDIISLSCFPLFLSHPLWLLT
jgi:hypothetical protein